MKHIVCILTHRECLRFGISELFYPVSARACNTTQLCLVDSPLLTLLLFVQGDIEKKSTRILIHILALRRLDRWRRKQSSSRFKEQLDNNFVQHSLTPTDFTPQHSAMDGNSRAPFSPSNMDYCDVVNKIDFIITTNVAMEGRCALQSYSEHAALYHGIISLLGEGSQRRLWKFLISYYPELFFRDGEVKSWDNPPVKCHEEHWTTIRALCRDGIPEDCRGWCWFALSGAYSRMLENTQMTTTKNRKCFYSDLCYKGMQLLSVTEDMDKFHQMARRVLGTSFNPSHSKPMRESFDQIKKDFRRTLGNVDPIVQVNAALEYNIIGSSSRRKADKRVSEDDFYGGSNTLTCNLIRSICPHKVSSANCSAKFILKAGRKGFEHLVECVNAVNLSYFATSPTHRCSNGVHTYGTKEANQRGRPVDDCNLVCKGQESIILFHPFTFERLQLSEALVEILSLPSLPTSLCYTVSLERASDIHDWLQAHIDGNNPEGQSHASYSEALLDAEFMIYVNPSSLWRVLGAMCIYLPSVGYCQGMNFIATHALRWLGEEESFWCMAQVIQCLFPGQGGYFSSMEIVSADQDIISSLIDDNCREHLKHLSSDDSQELRQSVSATTPRWNLCAFSSPFPPAFTDRIWDGLFQEGTSVLFRTSLAITRFVLEEEGPLEEVDIHEFVSKVTQFPEWIDKKLHYGVFSSRHTDKLQDNINLKEAFAPAPAKLNVFSTEDSQILWELQHALRLIHCQDGSFFDGVIIPWNSGNAVTRRWLRPQPYPTILTWFFNGVHVYTDPSGNRTPRPVAATFNDSADPKAKFDAILILNSVSDLKQLAFSSDVSSATNTDSSKTHAICIPVIKLIYPRDSKPFETLNAVHTKKGRPRAFSDLSYLHETFAGLKPRRATIGHGDQAGKSSGLNTRSLFNSPTKEKENAEEQHSPGPCHRPRPPKTDALTPLRLQEATNRKFKIFQKRQIKNALVEHLKQIITQIQLLLDRRLPESLNVKLSFWIPYGKAKKAVDMIGYFLADVPPLDDTEMSLFIWLKWMELFGLKGEEDHINGFAITEISILPTPQVFEARKSSRQTNVSFESSWAQDWGQIPFEKFMYRMEMNCESKFVHQVNAFPNVILRPPFWTACDRACIHLLAILLRDVSYWVLCNVYDNQTYESMHVQLDTNLKKVTDAALRPQEADRKALYPFNSKNLFGKMVALGSEQVEKSILPVLLEVAKISKFPTMKSSLVWSKHCEVSSSRLHTIRVALMAWNDHLSTTMESVSARGSEIQRLLDSERCKLQRGIVVNSAVEQLTEPSFCIHCGMVEPNPSDHINEDLHFVQANETQEQWTGRVLSMKKNVPLYHGSTLYNTKEHEQLENSSNHRKNGSPKKKKSPASRKEKRMGSFQPRMLRSVEQAKGREADGPPEDDAPSPIHEEENLSTHTVQFPCERKLAFWYSGKPQNLELKDKHFLLDTRKHTYSVSTLAVALVCKFKNFSTVSQTVFHSNPLLADASDISCPRSRSCKALSQTYMDVIRSQDDTELDHKRKNSAPMRLITDGLLTRTSSYSAGCELQEVFITPNMTHQAYASYMKSQGRKNSLH